MICILAAVEGDASISVAVLLIVEWSAVPELDAFTGEVLTGLGPVVLTANHGFNHLLMGCCGAAGASCAAVGVPLGWEPLTLLGYALAGCDVSNDAASDDFSALKWYVWSEAGNITEAADSNLVNGA